MKSSNLNLLMEIKNIMEISMNIYSCGEKNALADGFVYDVHCLCLETIDSILNKEIVDFNQECKKEKEEPKSPSQ